MMAGRYTAALAAGVRPYGGAVLRPVSMEYQTNVTLRAYLEIYSRSFALAAPTAAALLIPTERINGQVCGEDTPLSDLFRQQWKFKGFFLADDERFTHEPTAWSWSSPPCAFSASPSPESNGHPNMV